MILFILVSCLFNLYHCVKSSGFGMTLIIQKFYNRVCSHLGLDDYLTYSNKQSLQNEKLLRVRLYCDENQALLPHNDPKFILPTCLFPYKEAIYLNEQKKAFNKILSEEQYLTLNRQIYILKQEHLLKHFEIQQYYYIHIEKDGNSAPKAISLIKFGT